MSTQSIAELEKEIRDTPKNKATEKHIALLRARLAKLKMDLQARSRSKDVGYAVRKGGDATVAIVGFPSVGKSTLLNALTGTHSRTGEWDFTTQDVIPGMLEYNGARIQLLDVPGLIRGSSSGRGKQVLSVARMADLVLILLSPDNAQEQLDIIKTELWQAGFRLDRHRPDIRITKTTSGGIKVLAPTNFKLSDETVEAVLNGFGVFNAEVIIRENVDMDDIIDSLAKNAVYVPSLVVVNKCDRGYNGPFMAISALKRIGLEQLKEAIWSKLELMRIFMKKPGRPADTERPLILKKGSTVADVCKKICQDWLKDFKHARVWGSTKFGGQRVGLDYRLSDRDVVEIIRSARTTPS